MFGSKVGSTELRGGKKQILMAACDLVCAARAGNAPLASPVAPRAAAVVVQRGGCPWHRDVCGVGTDSRASPTAPAGQMTGAPLGIAEHRGVQRSQLSLFCTGITQTLEMSCCQLECCSHVNHNLGLTSLSLCNKNLLLHWIRLTVCFCLRRSCCCSFHLPSWSVSQLSNSSEQRVGGIMGSL